MNESSRPGRAKARPYTQAVAAHFSATDMDDAIDRVAARLVAVTDDGRVLHQVMTRLPERAASPWFSSMPVQLAVGAALLLIVFLSARPARESAPSEPLQIATVAPLDVPDPGSRPPAPGSRPPAPGSRTPAPGSRLPSVTRDRPDHERSLAPVPPLEALEVASIEAPAIEADVLDPLAPLVLTELALASDASSPREY